MKLNRIERDGQNAQAHVCVHGNPLTGNLCARTGIIILLRTRIVCVLFRFYTVIISVYYR